MKDMVVCPNCGCRFNMSWKLWENNEETDERITKRHFDECPECECELVTTCIYELVETRTEEE